MARKSYGGIQLTTDDWQQLEQRLRKKLAGNGDWSIALDSPSKALEYFASHLIGGDRDHQIFVKRLVLRRESALREEVLIGLFDVECHVSISDHGIELLVEGVRQMAEDSELDEFPLGKTEHCLRLHPFPKFPPGLPFGRL